MKPYIIAVVGLALATCVQDQKPPGTPRLVPASGVGVPRTTSVQPATTPSQSESDIDKGATEEDLEVTREIRENLAEDGSLSFSAQNVIIMTRNGVVTLRGQVSTAQERASIEKAARRVSSVRQVNNEIEVME